MPTGATRSELIDVNAASGALHTYVARPDGAGPWPGVLVIQEVFGLTDHIKAQADKLAGEGYVAVAPDLYSNDEVRATITIDEIEAAIQATIAEDSDAAIEALPEDQRAGVRRAFEWRGGIRTKMAGYVADTGAIAEWIRARDDVTTVGSIGWCMGGGVNAALAASGAELDAASVWYGPLPQADQVANIRCPMQLHYGTADALAGQVPDFEKAAKSAGKDVTAFLYEDAPHAFNNEQRASYREDASRLAWERTLAFFKERLGS